MKRLKQIVMGCCTALLIVLSANMTNACVDYWIAIDWSNSAECHLYRESGTSCYYACTCWGDCTSIYSHAGATKL